MNAALDAYALLVASVLFVGGVVLLGYGGVTYARALSAVMDARVRRVSADAQDETLAASAEALDDLHERRVANRRYESHEAPSDDELYSQIISEREYTTTGNEGIEEEVGISPDRMFVREEA